MSEWILVLSSACLIQVVYNLLEFFLLSLLLYAEVPLFIIRAGVLLLKSVGITLLSLYVYSFGFDLFWSLLISLFIAIGSGVAAHRAKRTTAAYSTSDTQNQRLYNASLIVILFFGCVSFAGFVIGRIPPQVEIPAFVNGVAQHGLARAVLLIFFAVALRFIYLTLSNLRTLFYLIGSYIVLLRGKKMKRFW